MEGGGGEGMRCSMGRGEEAVVKQVQGLEGCSVEGPRRRGLYKTCWLGASPL